MSKSLLKSSYVVAAMTVITRIVGMVREIVFASLFGTVAGMDAFLVAFRIPNFMRRLFAEGAFSQAFVPVLSEYRQKRSSAEAQEFINRMAGTLAFFLIITTLIAVIITPLIVVVFAPGFIHDPTRFGLAAGMLRITFPYLLLISLTAFAGSIFNSYDVFSIPSITPVLLNISLICAAIFLAPRFRQPVYALAWGVLIGGIAQLCFQLPFLKRIKRFPIPKLNWRDAGVRQVLKLMIPAVFGVSVAQISVFVDTLFASFLREGSISWLYYSDRLVNFPLGVFGIAIATVILPHLSRNHANDSQAEYSALMDWALRCILAIALPATVGILMLSGPIFATILQHGKFNAFDVIMATRSLMAFSVGLPSFMLVKVLVTGFYSRQDIKTPVKIAAFVMVINMFLNFILIFPLAHAGLALATSLTTTLNATLLLYILIKRKVFKAQSGWKKYLQQLTFANLCLIAFILLTHKNIGQWLQWNTEQKILHLGIILLGAIVIYLICLLISGLRWKHFVNT